MDIVAAALCIADPFFTRVTVCEYAHFRCQVFSSVVWVLITRTLTQCTAKMYSAKDIAFATLKALGATAQGAVVVGKGLFGFAKEAKSIPVEV